MTNIVPIDRTPEHYRDPVSIAAAAFLARYKTNTRRTYTIALRSYLNWCRLNGLDPMAAQRPHIELFSRWMEGEKYERTTHSKYISVVCLFYKFCLIDGRIDIDPAVQVRRIPWPTDSPTLGLTHLQFEAMLHAAKESDNPSDGALVVMLGMLGLRSFEAGKALIEDLGEEHGHRVLSVLGKGDKKVLIPLPPAVARMIDRAVGERMSGPIVVNQIGNAMDGQAQARALKRIAKLGGVKTTRMHPHMLRHTFVTTMLDAGVDIRDVQIAARHADPRTTTRYDRARENLDRHGNYILAAYMAGAT
ncbi:MAG TPA: tyrosine-type recombinase/integrase [Amycolatopsis sp.]|nr:tyrosine-type recombinase/integrase [Amycolatopsis sp.]